MGDILVKKIPVSVLQDMTDIYDEWNVRGFVILSLLLQTFLILFAPMRKRSGSNLLMMTLWSAYILADKVPHYSIGVISNSIGYCPTTYREEYQLDCVSDDLIAFWAPFLLVHLGGPDTITALALEDNELWRRQFLGLFFQLATTVYAFAQSIRSRMWIPTLIMFLPGIIKCGERIWFLYNASLDNFRDSVLEDPIPEYPEYSSKKEGELSKKEILLYASNFFNTFRGLIVDLSFSFQECKESREFFLKRTAEDAFGVVEAELNLMYAYFFTKFTVVYSRLGYLGRSLSFSAVVATLVLFIKESKSDIEPVDIAITYMLICGAIALEIIAALMLVSSEWFKLKVINGDRDRTQTQSVVVVEVQTQTQTETSQSSGARNPFVRLQRFFTRRWSESVKSFNLIYYCLHPCSTVMEKIIRIIGITNSLNSLRYVENNPFTEALRYYIFTELKFKAEKAAGLDTAISNEARSFLVSSIYGPDEGIRKDILRKYILEVKYDESLLVWHIATELCFNDEIDKEHNTADYRSFAKLLSDYMLYLLVMQPTMMSAVTLTGLKRFRVTCAETRMFFLKEHSEEPSIQNKAGNYCSRLRKCFYTKPSDHREEQTIACKKLLGVNTDADTITVNYNRTNFSESMLFDGCKLAKKLQELPEEERWKLMSKVWVDILSYAACHCRADEHAQQLSRGGELLTIVWLLMTHLGIDESVLLVGTTN